MSTAETKLAELCGAQIVARELGVGFRSTSGPVIAKSGDLAALLTNLEEGDVLFIDEIHRLNPVVEEVLYPAMEDRALDIMIGEGPSARSVRIDLPAFTLVGATTRQGLLTTPLRDRFGIPVRLNFYNHDELEQVVSRAAKLLDLDIAPDGAQEVAKRSRGTPRVAGRLLRRVRDFANVAGDKTVTAKSADAAPQDREKKRKERIGEIKLELHKALLDNLNLAALESASEADLRQEINAIAAESLEEMGIVLNREERQTLVKELLKPFKVEVMRSTFRPLRGQLLR